MLRRNRKLAVFAITAAMLSNLFCLTGCSEFRLRQIGDGSENGTASETSTTAATTSAFPTESETTETTPPDPDEAAKDEALRIAEEQELTEEDLRGKYDLFLRFSNCIETNGRLGDFEPYVYRLFPMVADHLTPENEEYFLAKLSSLSMAYQGLPKNYAGEYHFSRNDIVINTMYLDSDEFSVLATVMHELIHFVDANIDGPVEKVAFTSDGVYPFDEVPSDVKRSSLYGDDAEFLTEGCAELYTGKYFCHYARAYTPGVQFLTGVEYILGSDIIDEMFFRHDTAWFFADILMQHGFEVDEIRSFYKTMYAMSYWKKPTSDIVRPEDVLIRLYQDVIGEDYQGDPAFCHILACIYSPDFDFDEFPSENEDFLKSIQLTGDTAKEWTDDVLDQLLAMPDFRYFDAPICCIFLDGKLYLAAEIALFDENDVMLPHDGLVIEYDFSSGEVLSYGIFTSPLSDYQIVPEKGGKHGAKKPVEEDAG